MKKKTKNAEEKKGKDRKTAVGSKRKKPKTQVEKPLRPVNPSQEISPNLCGILRMHARGFGFVIPHAKIASAKDIFIPKHMMGDAVDGDEVEVAVNPQSLSSEKGPDGKIIYIVKRGRSHLAGIIREIGSSGIVHVHVPLLGTTRPVVATQLQQRPKSDPGSKSGTKAKEKGASKKLKVGDRVILHITTWGKQGAPIIGEVCHYLGHISDPSIDIKAAAEEFDLHNEFSPEAIAEAKSLGSRVTPRDLAGREDLRKLECFTIDPKTARDFDDALSLRKDRKGHYHLGVHIADVAHYIQPGSYIDREAQARCNSTYFPGQCFPMLPEALSNHLCSLRPNVLRLTVSVLVHLDKKGTLVDYKIVRSVIKSKKRMTYEEAKSIIDGKKQSAHAKSLALMVELCLLLKKQRATRGSIDFALPEAVIQIDPQGRPYGVEIVEYDISHQLVEEYMLKANEMVATHFAKRQQPLLYRVHEEPAQENFQDFFNLARSLGYFLPAEPTQQDLQKLFEEAKGTPSAYQLSVGFIRSMKLASYSPENMGHYGLALENYCHFTSPIRRYSDLVTQWLLFGQEPEETNLDTIATRCSEQERISFKAESSVKLLKKLRLLQQMLDENPTEIYQATVTKIKPFGLFFEIAHLMLEGFLHISNLENDYFIYDQRRGTLFGRNSGRVHSIGEIIRVELVSVDFILQESKWQLASSRPSKTSPNALPKAKKNRGHYKSLKRARRKSP